MNQQSTATQPRAINNLSGKTEENLLIQIIESDEIDSLKNFIAGKPNFDFNQIYIHRAIHRVRFYS